MTTSAIARLVARPLLGMISNLPDYTRAASINKNRDTRNVTRTAALRPPGQRNGTR
jgi:hypothetical protein